MLIDDWWFKISFIELAEVHIYIAHFVHWACRNGHLQCWFQISDWWFRIDEFWLMISDWWVVISSCCIRIVTLMHIRVASLSSILYRWLLISNFLWNQLYQLHLRWGNGQFIKHINRALAQINISNWNLIFSIFNTN